MGSGAESSYLKCLADKWWNLQLLSMGSDSEFSNPNFPTRSQIPTFCPYNGKHADQQGESTQLVNSNSIVFFFFFEFEFNFEFKKFYFSSSTKTIEFKRV